MLVLALAGLLAMHGLDASGMTHVGADTMLSPTEEHAGSPEAAPGARAAHRPAAMSQHSTRSPAVHGLVPAKSDDRTSGVAVHHLVAMCIVVLGTVAAGVLHRLLARVRTRRVASVNPALAGAPPPSRVFRPPRLRLAELCVLTC